jgi:hypothetical protein
VCDGGGASECGCALRMKIVSATGAPLSEFGRKIKVVQGRGGRGPELAGGRAVAKELRRGGGGVGDA